MKKFFKILGIIIGLLLIAGLLLFWLTPREKLLSWFAPTIEGMRVTDARIGEQEATMQIQLDISSGLIPVLIDSLSYDMRLYGKSVAKGNKNFDQDTKEGKRQKLTIPVSMNHNKTRELVRRQVAEDAPVDAHMQVYADMPLFGRQKFDINEQLDMVVPALPGMEVISIDIEDFGLDNMEMTMTMRIDNPNEFGFYIKEMKMDLQLHEHMVSVGNRSKDKFIKAHSKTELTIPAVSDMQKPLKAAFRVIKGDAEWPYKMKTFMVINPASDFVGEIEINSVKTGTVNVVQQIKNIKEEKEAAEEKEGRE